MKKLAWLLLLCASVAAADIKSPGVVGGGAGQTLAAQTLYGNPQATSAVAQDIFIGPYLNLSVSSPLIHAGAWAKTGSTTTNTYTFSGVLANDSLTIAIGCWGGTVPNTCTAPATFVDSTGQTWTSRGFVVTSNTATVYNVGVALYDLLGTAQAGTHTITVTGTGAYDMQGSEWAGTIVFDQFTSALTGVNAGTTSLTVGTLTPAQNNEIAIAWTINGTGGAGTISDPATYSGFTYTSLAYLQGTGGNGISLEASYLTTTATTPAVGATWAYGTSASNAAGLALYKYTQATGILSGTGNAITVNGGAVPASDPCVGTNSSSQIIPCVLATNQLAITGAALALANPLVTPGPMSSQSVTVTGDFVHAGMAAILGNTTLPTLPTNTVALIGPNSASFTAYGLQLPVLGPSANSPLYCGALSGGFSTCTWGGSVATPSTAALGDIWYGSSTNVMSALAGNSTTTALCLQQTGTGSASAAPVWGACGGGGISSANPTGTVGLSTINGSLSTFMRSDAAPPLSQAIVPTWTGVHTFSATPVLNAGLTLSNAANSYTRTSTGLSITSGTTGFGDNITGTVNDSSAVNGINWFSNTTCTLCTSPSWLVQMQVGGTSEFEIGTTGQIIAAGQVLGGGASGSFVSSTGVTTCTACYLRLANTDSAYLISANTALQTITMSGTASAASPIAATLQGSPASGSNVVGGAATYQCGASTGNAAGCTTNIAASHVGTTGSTAQSFNVQIAVGDNTVALPNIAQSSAAQTGTVCYGTSGNITYDATLGCLTSALRWKRDIEPLSGGLTELMQLRPISYELKPEFDPLHLGRQVGFGAEDVEQVDKCLVGYGPDGAVRGVRYMQITALITEGVQELAGDVVALQAKVERQQIEIYLLAAWCLLMTGYLVLRHRS